MEKFLLFYSNYCHYSKTLLEEIKKKEMGEIFLFICIDTNMYTIPSFVDRVPMVYQKNSKQIFIEDNIINLINHISEINKNAAKNLKLSDESSKTKNTKEEIESYSQVEMNNNFSDNFSFLDNNSQKRSFVFIENDEYNENAISVNQPQSTNDGQSKIDSSEVEKYMMQRDADFNKVMQNMKQNT
jgi:hypothetical protein